MQNLNRHSEIEIVSCVDEPEKDSGLLLMPLEKLRFHAKKEESIYARCADIDGTHANLSVVNFNVSFWKKLGQTVVKISLMIHLQH